MSELRVDNIVSADGSAAPIYSRGMNIPSGQTLTNNGNFIVGGATSIAGNTRISGVTTFAQGANITGDITVTGGLNVSGSGNFNTTGIITAGSLNVTGTTTFNDITGNVTDLTVTGNLTVQGTTTTIDSVNLVVEDKNIGIGTTSTPSNSTADGGGLTLFGGTDGDKTITWQNSTGDWNVDGGGLRIQGKGAATTGKAIAMAMVFGG